MTFEELISFLGYAGSPHYLRRDDDGRFESELGCGHIFRRAVDPCNPKHPSWRAEGVYGLRDALDGRFTPVIYLCTAKDEAAAHELHRLLWNQDIAPFVWTQSAALTDAGEIIGETLSGAHA
jgi:hypothetical protein